MSKFLEVNLSRLDAYTPGEQPRDKKYIKLNTNESPFPPSAEVIKAINEEKVKDLRLYCDPECKVLKNELAKLYKVESKNVFVSNGSDDILNFAFMAYGHRGAIFPDITYGFYSVFAELHSVKYREIPLKDDFTIDIEDYLGTSETVVIPNPNAPTGILLSLCEIEKIVKDSRDRVVVIDEAYIDFGGTSAIELTKKYNNLIVVCTFSKSRSLAGGRLGFAIADEQLISDLEKIKYSTNPYNVNSLTQIAGIATLKSQEYYDNNCKEIIKNREYTTAELKKIGFTVLPSYANFIFAKSDSISGEKLYKELKDRGILVRHFDKNRICEFNRITIGDRYQMETFVKTVKEILGGNP